MTRSLALARPLPAPLLASVSVILTVAWKEIRSYFSSAMAYVLIVVTLWIVWDRFIFVLAFAALSQGDVPIAGLISMIPQVFLFVIPLVAMRLLSEEKSTGTIEMLLTSPVTEWQVVIGKFLGSYVIVAAMVGITLHLPWLAARHGTIDMGPVRAAYLGTMLVGAAFLSIGLFMSALTESQVISGFLTFLSLVLLLFVGSWGQNTSSTMLGIEWNKVFSEIAIFGHLDRMVSGDVHTKGIIYYASFTFFFLYCTVKWLESRKWR